VGVMDVERNRFICAELKKYTEKSTVVALFYFFIDFSIYISLLLGTLLTNIVLLKVFFAVGAGLVISSLFVIGHDAAHNNYTSSKILNRTIAKIAFLPALHNYSLWRLAHSRFHHVVTNLKNSNSWSPMSKSEFDSLTLWRQWVEKTYRSPLGIGVYYLCERWWKYKFFPMKKYVGQIEAKYYWDFSIVMVYLVFLLTGLGIAGNIIRSTTAQSAIFYGFLVPFVVWNYAMGLTVYLQHTNKKIPWFDNLESLNNIKGQDKVTMHLLFPAWYGLISHNIMEHTAHHIQPKIPFYNLKHAQSKLSKILEGELIVERFTPSYLFRTMKACKIYDYENHLWQDFHGSNTSTCTLPRITEQGVNAVDREDYRLRKSA
jgi:omega-6 fatty acid desaturase (delta-12 desaturase)